MGDRPQFRPRCRSSFLLDRYLLRQLLLPLLIGLAVFVVIMMSETAISLGRALTGSRVPPLLILRYFYYSLPRAVAWSLPVGVLVGVAMVSTLMTRNGEAVAARAGGASLQRLWAAFFAVGAVCSGVAFSIEEFVVPESNQRATRAFLQMTNTQPVLRSRSDQTFRDKDGRLFYVGRMDDRTNRLQNVMVLEEDDQGRWKTVTAAQWGLLRGQTWVLRKGAVITFGPSGEPVGAPQRFWEREVRLWSALQDYYLDQRTEFEMTTGELRAAATALETSGMDAQRMKVRLQFKYSIPVACLVFVVVAAPLAMRYAHLGSFVGIVLSILIVFLYNGVRSWGLAFGLVGELPPVVAAWAQNVIFGVIGVVLVARAR